MPSLGPFTPGVTVSRTVTGTTARVAITGAGEQITITSAPDNTLAFINFGDSAVTAAVTDFPVAPGTEQTVTIPPGATHVAAIGTTGTTLYFSRGDGSATGLGFGAGGGGSVVVTSVTPGTGATNLGKAEDAVHTSGDVGVMALGVVTDGSTSLASVGDYSVIGTDAAGNVRNVGNVASGATDSGNPVKIGAVYLAAPGSVTNAQRIDAQADTNGNLRIVGVVTSGTGVDTVANTSLIATPLVNSQSSVMRLYPQAPHVFDATGTVWTRQRGNTTGTIVIPPQGWIYAAATGGIVNTTTAVTLKTAAASGVRNYLGTMQIETTGALGAATEIAVRDGAGGTVLWRSFIPLAGIVTPLQIVFDPPIYSTAATLLEFVTLTASVTGGVYVNAQGYSAP